MSALEHDDDEVAEEPWHAYYLQQLGVDAALALAHGDDVDPHEVEDLIAKGCAPDFAVRFLLP